MKNKDNFIGFREDTEDFFRWSTSVNPKKKHFTPFIILHHGKVFTEWYWCNLLPKWGSLSDDDIIMQVWPGFKSGDCFIFTIGELKEYVKQNKLL